ncbi:MAG: O-antigen ligase family protein [Anaerolineales bacterium]
MFVLILSAAMVGTAIPIVEDIASLVRWLALFLLLFSGLLFSRFRISIGMLFFWGYVYLGFVFLFRSTAFVWQFQRGMLLLIVAIAIPVAFSKRSYQVYKTALVLIAVAGTIFAFINLITIPGSLNNPIRFIGYAKTAPFFAVTLGGLLPFSFWGLWNAKTKIVKTACGIGFITGTAALLISGQRTGTVAGLIALIPLGYSIIRHKKKIGVFSLLIILLFFSISYLLLNSSSDRISFLLSRYSLNAGLSNRDLIWQAALSKISINPILGEGIGASERVISSSFHNAYLEVWYNTGFIGLLLFIISQIIFFFRIIYLNKLITDPEKKSIVALALGYMLGFSVSCVFESLGAGASTMNLLLYLFLGTLISDNVLIEALPLPFVSQRTLRTSPI